MHEPDDIILQCNRIRAKADLLELAFRWKCATGERSDLSFGVETHRFHLRGKLSEWKIGRFEKANGIALPESYRAFLKHVGNGGAGPYHGMLRLWWYRADHPLGRLASPFPFVPDRPFGEQAKANPLPSNAECWGGAMKISHTGCGRYQWLVVTGVARGRVFLLSDSEVCNDYVDFTVEPDFLSWYEQWQDRMMAEMDPAGCALLPESEKSEAMCRSLPDGKPGPTKSQVFRWARAYSLYARARTWAFGLSLLLLLGAFAAKDFRLGSEVAASWGIGCGFLLLLAAFFGAPKWLLRLIWPLLNASRPKSP
jgi:hypothetical protein